MDDRGLYQTILGLAEPWEVARVELRETEQAVHVFVEVAPDTALPCPDCPLGDALREYAAAKDRDKLLSLLVRDRNVNRPASRIPHHVERVGGPGEGVPGRTGSGARGSGATCAFMGNSRTAIPRPVLSSSSSLVLNDPARSREVGVDLAPRLLFGSFRHRTTPA